MNPAISIIVPVYNAEKTIRKCVDSLLNQTFENFEILLVDDGSPDKCGEICDEYSTKDNRVRVFHKENGGVASARQCGIDNALGEYTIHADPDDWVETNMLMALYTKAKSDDADMVICDYYEDGTKCSKYRCQRPTALDHLTVLKDVFSKLHGSCWNKLIKRDCYIRYNVRFPLKVSYCEDQFVMASFLKNNINIQYLPQAYYHYVNILTKDSLSRHYDAATYMEDVSLIKLYYENFKDIPFYRCILSKRICSMMTRAFYFGHSFYSSNVYKDKFYRFRHIICSTSDLPQYERCIVYLSCCGYYNIIFEIYNWTFKIKQCLNSICKIRKRSNQ
jgi:glycosyltransferase involved in cell wall biosynthesis